MQISCSLQYGKYTSNSLFVGYLNNDFNNACLIFVEYMKILYSLWLNINIYIFKYNSNFLDLSYTQTFYALCTHTYIIIHINTYNIHINTYNTHKHTNIHGYTYSFRFFFLPIISCINAYQTRTFFLPSLYNIDYLNTPNG